MAVVVKLLVAVLPRAVQWRLRADGPNEVPIAGHPGWLLVTPIGLARTGLAEGVPDGNARAILTKTDELFMMSQRFALRHTGSDEGGGDAVFRHVLSRLRYLSRQPTVPRGYVGFVELNRAPNYDGDLSALGASRLLGYEVRNYLFETAITATHLHELGGPNSTPQVHVEIMLDALEACIDGDVRKAILYSAIAVEACAAAVLEDAYDEAVRTRQPQHRVIDVRVAGGDVVAKDPVYLGLSDSFSALLHERPLYLRRRSLLVDNAETYRLATMLYKTRNKLAHRGTHDDNEKCFPLTKEGADEALAAAVATLLWLGDGPYVCPGAFVTPCE